MKRRQAAFFFVLVLALALPARAQPELLGRLLDKVECEGDPAQTYALYVPSTYVSARKWPVIFCFDAGARGRMPVEILQAAAEKYGYIVAGSLTSRNGPWTANAAAAQAMIKDVSSHLSIDRQRIYTTGVSGGARVATTFAISGLAKGVIACAAGFPVPDDIPAQVPFVFFGTAGIEDPNYSELQRLDAELEERKAVHRIVFSNGGHEWASAALMTEAVEWLELQAMRSGAREKNDAFVREMLRGRIAAVPAQPALARWRALKSLSADFAGLAPVDELAQEAKQLGASREVRDQLKTERTLDAREQALFEQLIQIAEEGSASERRKIAARLRPQAEAPEDSGERQVVRRAIAAFLLRTRESSREFFENKDYDKAEGFFELAAALRPDQPRTLFDLARAYAGNGNRKRALESLAQAVAAGFIDSARLESEPLFAKIRHDPEFQKIQARLSDASAGPVVQLPAMRVSAALANIELRLFYLPNSGFETPPLSFLRVETVRPNTAAARAGVVEGMEITAIQGTRIRGLRDPELNDLMMRPVKEEIVFTARDSSNSREREIHIPLRKAEPAQPKSPADATSLPR